MDTAELYQRHRQEQPELLRRHGWWDYEPFEYRFNSQGFRCDEFNQDGIVFLGCSLTLGIGIPQKDSWPERVAKQLGLPCINLGQGAGSMDTCFRLASLWIPKLRPRMVILLEPFAERIEIIDPFGSTEFLSPQSHGSLPLYRRWLLNPVNAELNTLRNRLAIQQMAESVSARFLHWSSEAITSIAPSNLARDLAHPGIITHSRFAETVLKRIESTQ